MNQYTEIIRAYLAEREPNYGTPYIHSLLEMLFTEYCQVNPVTDHRVRDRFEELEDQLDSLAFRDKDQVISTAGNLCFAAEESAFLEGVRVGARLVAELLEL